MIELKDQEPAATAVKPMDIYVDGEKVGDVKPCLGSDGKVAYMASINVAAANGPSSGLIFGWGDTRHRAILDAIERGREDAKRFADDVEAFATKCGAGLPHRDGESRP